MRTRNFLACAIFGVAFFASPASVLATGAGDGSATCTVNGPIRCEGGDSTSGSTGDTLPAKVRPPAPSTTVPTTPPATTVTTVPVTTVPVTTVPPGVPEQTQVSPGVPQENQVPVPGAPEQNQVSPGNSAEGSSGVSSNSDNTTKSNASKGTPKSSVTDRVSKATIEAIVPIGTPVPSSATTLQTQTSPTLVIDPSEGPQVTAAASPSVLNHLWPESILAGLALGVTAYGAVVVSRRRSERSIADEDLEMLLISAQNDNSATASRDSVSVSV